MAEEAESSSSLMSSIFASPNNKSQMAMTMRGVKGLGSIYHSNTASTAHDDTINDHHLAQRKAGEAASRRNQAAEWLRQMDHGASQSLPTRPSEEDFCVALRNGLILCNVLNRVNPGAVHKVVDNPVIPVQSTEAAAQSAIQYFENMRNFLMAVGKMKLLTFEASHLEGGSSNKVVDCILCLKGFYEWKQAGGIGVWRYGGTVRITSLPKESPFSSVASDSTDESVADSEASHCEHILDFLSLSSVISTEESRAANALVFLFDHFGVGLILAYLNEQNGIADFPLNATSSNPMAEATRQKQFESLDSRIRELAANGEKTDLRLQDLSQQIQNLVAMFQSQKSQPRASSSVPTMNPQQNPQENGVAGVPASNGLFLPRHMKLDIPRFSDS